jgi:hypothetical protein
MEMKEIVSSILDGGRWRRMGDDGAEEGETKE